MAHIKKVKSTRGKLTNHLVFVNVFYYFVPALLACEKIWCYGHVFEISFFAQKHVWNAFCSGKFHFHCLQDFSINNQMRSSRHRVNDSFAKLSSKIHKFAFEAGVVFRGQVTERLLMVLPKHHCCITCQATSDFVGDVIKRICERHDHAACSLLLVLSEFFCFLSWKILGP